MVNELKIEPVTADDQFTLLLDATEAFACYDFPPTVNFFHTENRRIGRSIHSNGKDTRTLIIRNCDPSIEDPNEFRVYGTIGIHNRPTWKLSPANGRGVEFTSPRRQDAATQVPKDIRVRPRVKPRSPFVDALEVIKALGGNSRTIELFGCRSEIPLGDDTPANNVARLFDNSWRIFMKLEAVHHLDGRLISHLVIIPQYWKGRKEKELGKVSKRSIVVPRIIEGEKRYFEFSRGIHGKVTFLFDDEPYSQFLP